jgi:hypothetical protein
MESFFGEGIAVAIQRPELGNSTPPLLKYGGGFLNRKFNFTYKNLATMKIQNFKTEWAMFPGPCYSPQDKYGDCPQTMLEILNDERIPATDRIWAFANCTVIPEGIKRLAACAFVRHTPLADGRFVWDLLTDDRSRNAVVVSEKFAVGEATQEELAAAWDAAWDAAGDAAVAAARAAAVAAAWDAAWDAARAAAWDAARAAAWDAAGDAARAAAVAAAWDAAWDAAGDAARAAARAAAGDAQIQIIKSFLTE